MYQLDYVPIKPANLNDYFVRYKETNYEKYFNEFLYFYETVLNQYAQVVGNAHLRITYHEDSFGTGTKVELIDSSNLVVLRTFYVVIFGDVTGDSLVEEVDFEIIKQVASAQTDFSGSKCFTLAGDLNRDGVIDAFDYNLIKAIKKGIITLESLGL